jgi:hypothetical protein
MVFSARIWLDHVYKTSDSADFAPRLILENTHLPSFFDSQVQASEQR